VKSDHRENTVGPWAKQKLDALESYLIAYKTVMKNQPFKLVFVDAFAGSGIAKIRKPDSKDTVMEAFLEKDEAEAADEFIKGSPLRALGLDIPFDHYFFIDRDPSRVELLNALQKEHPERDIRAKAGDANAEVQEIARNFTKWNLRGVAFLDPYGAHLHWSTLEALASTEKFDVIINFPLEMAINRLLKRDTNIPSGWRDQLNLCFGCEDWHDAAFEKTGGLFGEHLRKRSDAKERLLDLYITRLKTLFGNVAGPSEVLNTRGTPLYHLIWASSNPRGQKIAKHILDLGHRVTVRRKPKTI
jgi:three-Cys-motif partner protein